MRRGEVWSVDLPSTGGREQAGRRPIAIVQRDGADRRPLVSVVPFTSRLEAIRFDGTVRIEPSETNGLTMPSIALVFQVTSIDRIRFKTCLGSLSEADLARVDASLRDHLGL